MPVENVLADKILDTKEHGEGLYDTFLKNRILSTKEKIHDPIKRQEKALFQNTGKKVSIQQNGKEVIVEVNREIIGTLLALSAKHEKLIDFQTALQYPLCPIPLSLVHPDGNRRKTTKSTLMKVISSYKISDDEDTFPPKQNSAFIIDLMALIRTVSPIPSTYGQLVRKLVDYLPKGYRRVDIIADTYRECSLKSNERDSRGVSDKVIVASPS